ncbi:hypothetical protein VOLCADRAFT_90948 [Volvox carteri f. nagariensis]|uniref:U6 snRNA-associated Sm-like protein LSm8 n=1 Tax=Volvox carteri f. nagariensis TaxID=3068 RepID=D8TVT2_VOLCA|nr:uncharacterized protein VOLCADRAFT_90948 [Volvox carteri f. nagariensis]EFJ48249.1 hypothetical protein VOLCADRAFT_90948 [Volvox carteri f. nagariensis]|eukprot:XP_002950503.1 hypothetical protein VOLCADRAFT_90948 [Volvox carteri f. nagariensis]
MASGETGLASLVGTQISVITNDGKHYVGILRGYDQATNLLLQECQERVYSTKSGVQIIQNPGVYCIRGDNVAVVGEVDEEADSQLDLSAVRAPPLAPIHH